MLKEKHFLLKNGVNALMILVGILVVVQMMTGIQNKTAQRKQQAQSQRVLQEVAENIRGYEADAEDLTQIFHEGNQSVLDDLTYLFSSGFFAGWESDTDEQAQVRFREIATTLDVDYLGVVDRQGNVVMAEDEAWLGANVVTEGILDQRALESLTTGSGTHNADGSISPVASTVEGINYYFYSAQVNVGRYKRYLLLAEDREILDVEYASLNNVQNVLRNATVSGNGFIFAVDSRTGKFIYYNDGSQDLSGEVARNYGLSTQALKDDYAGTETINGVEYFCVSMEYGSYTIITAAVTTSGLYSGNSKVVFWAATLFVLAMLVTLVYATIVKDDLLRHNLPMQTRRVCRFGKEDVLLFNRTVAARVLPITAASLVFLCGTCFYVQSLLALNTAISESTSLLEDIERRIDDRQEFQGTILSYYNERYLAKAKMLAFILENDPAALNEGASKNYTQYNASGLLEPVLDSEGNVLCSIPRSEALISLAESNGLEDIYIFDEQGRTIATTGDNWYFILSLDESSQSYPFRSIIEGKADSLVQDQMVSDTGTEQQYIGTAFTYYTYTGEDGGTVYASPYDYEAYKEGAWEGNPITAHTSLLQIAIKSTILDRLVTTTSAEYIFRNLTVDENGFMIAFDNTSDHTVVYSPVTSAIGKTAAELGISEKAFSGSYNGFMTISGTDYFQCYRYYNGYYIATAIPTSDIYYARTPLSLITTLICFFFITMLSAMVTLSTEKEDEALREMIRRQSADDDSEMTITMPTGEKKRTSAVDTRWQKGRVHWNAMDPQHKLVNLLKGCGSLIVFYLMLTVAFSSTAFGKDSVVPFILGDEWDKGFNIFAISKCMLIGSVILIGVRFMNMLIRMVTRVMGTKSETIGQLLMSVLKYGSALASIFYFMYLIGFDYTSIITVGSVGAVVVGLGSQSLISDILAGIFIVFEGEFRVGDIVTIDGFRGQVLEIGLRTTKVMDALKDIKIFNNSQISGVLNMTREISVAVCRVGVEYDQDIVKLETLLHEELPKIKHRIPQITGRLYVRGVESLDDSAVVLRIDGECAEKDRVMVTWALNREILTLFQKHNISIPFPQTTISFREEDEREKKMQEAKGKNE